MCSAHLIPDEILINHLFLRLPVKSIIRFKCLNKTWNQKLSDPYFARKHLIQNPQHDEKLALESYKVHGDLKPFKFYSIDPESSTHNSTDAAELLVPLPVSESRIMGSSNGLLCAFLHYPRKFYIRSRKTRSRKRDLVIWNPSTGDSKLIRNPPRRVYNLGFCYDPSINDAKIVCFNTVGRGNPNRPRTSEVDIYSLKTDKWEIIKDSSFDLKNIVSLTKGCAVDMSGSVYWLVGNYDTKTMEVIEFNIKDNKFRRFETPLSFQVIIYYTGLRVFGGFLSLYGTTSIGDFGLWRMKDGAWERMIWINYYHLKFADSSEKHFMPQCLMRNGKYVCYIYAEKLREKLEFESKYVLFDPETEEIEDFYIHGINGTADSAGITYIQSLISPSSISQGC